MEPLVSDVVEAIGLVVDVSQMMEFELSEAIYVNKEVMNLRQEVQVEEPLRKLSGGSQESSAKADEQPLNRYLTSGEEVKPMLK